MLRQTQFDMTNEEVSTIVADIRELLQSQKSILGTETEKAVLHYLNHNEYEMAFEGLFIDFMELDYWPDGCNIDQWTKTGFRLGLSKESVFKGSFWDDLMRFNIRHNKAEYCQV